MNIFFLIYKKENIKGLSNEHKLTVLKKILAFKCTAGEKACPNEQLQVENLFLKEQL